MAFMLEARFFSRNHSLYDWTRVPAAIHFLSDGLIGGLPAHNLSVFWIPQRQLLVCTDPIGRTLTPMVTQVQ